jgi:uncharacterized DUF497 family protein
MRIDFDPAKSARNERERGLPFSAAAGFAFDSAIVELDARRDYPEPRYVAVGFLGERLHVLCFTPLPDGLRVISFRKANAREIKAHAQATSLD